MQHAWRTRSTVPPAKTQAALLEVMEEGKVTVDNETHPVPQPFVVIATENPTGSSGTQMLPESQLDRFMISLSMGYPDHENLVELLRDRQTKKSVGERESSYYQRRSCYASGSAYKSIYGRFHPELYCNPCRGNQKPSDDHTWS